MTIRKRKGIKLKKLNKTQMQQIAEVVERNWLDSCSETKQNEVEDQMDTVEAYEMMLE